MSSGAFQNCQLLCSSQNPLALSFLLAMKYFRQKAIHEQVDARLIRFGPVQMIACIRWASHCVLGDGHMYC